ncbi:hypothetical protein ACP70R_033387 [Stipagrostis hirtigluma subsp. patula]
MARTPMLIVLSCLSAVVLASGGVGATGIHMELTHVDAKGSYTAAERVRRAAAVTRDRLASMRGSAGGGGVSAPVHWATRQYVASYLVGDPPQRAEAIVDTGSDLVWTQCATCLRAVCARQDLPYFNASRSGTFAPVPCRGGGGGGADRACAANDVHLCALDGSCTFVASYGAGGIIGSLATDAFTFQSGAATLAFGCVSFARLTPGSLQGASGLIGLGRGRLSLVSQTGAGRFSYCLTPYFHNNGATSHLFVGAAASLAGGGVTTSMPFVESPKDFPYSSFYYLPLVGLTVGEAKLRIPSSSFDLRQLAPGFWVGGVIIDSGSPFTSLADDAYEALGDELSRQLNGSLVPPPGDSGGMALCVRRGDVGKVVPKLVFHFGGGADMVVPPESYWAPLDESTACMVIADGGDQTLIGNFQQQNMHVLYDVAGGRLSFQATDCSKL